MVGWEGTFGQNQAGFDTKGRFHKAKLVVSREYIGMLGGVFMEKNDRSQPHFYIAIAPDYESIAELCVLSRRNYNQLADTVLIDRSRLREFIRDVFAHANLPEPVRNVYGRVKDKSEWVALYSGFSYHFLTMLAFLGPNDPTDSSLSRLAAAR